MEKYSFIRKTFMAAAATGLVLLLGGCSQPHFEVLGNNADELRAMAKPKAHEVCPIAEQERNRSYAERAGFYDEYPEPIVSWGYDF